MHEKAPRSVNKSESIPKPEEDLLAHFRSSCEIQTSSDMPHETKVQTYHSLHEDLDHLENAPMIGQYEHGMIPTIQSLIEAAQVASIALESETEDEAALRIGKLIRGQAGSIRTWCRRYVSTIIKFHTMKRQMLRMNDEEKRMAFQAADTERRRVHESLLNCLKTFNALLEEGKDHAEYSAPRVWQTGTLLAEGTAIKEAVIFSPNAVQDRDLIKSWAIAADSVEELRKIFGTDDFPPDDE